MFHHSIWFIYFFFAISYSIFLSHQNGNNSMKCSTLMVDIIPFELRLVKKFVEIVEVFIVFCTFSDIYNSTRNSVTFVFQLCLDWAPTKLITVPNVLWWDSNRCDNKQYAFDELLSLVWHQMKHVPVRNQTWPSQ